MLNVKSVASATLHVFVILDSKALTAMTLTNVSMPSMTVDHIQHATTTQVDLFVSVGQVTKRKIMEMVVKISMNAPLVITTVTSRQVTVRTSKETTTAHAKQALSRPTTKLMLNVSTSMNAQLTHTIMMQRRIVKILSAATIASVTKDSLETALSAKPTSKVVIQVAVGMLIAKEQLTELVDFNEIQKSVNATVDTKVIQFYLLLVKT